MPLARILTLSPEHAGALAQQLESRGYQVEFGHPEALISPIPDLLVSFDLSPQDAALARATELAQEFQCDVVVERGFEAETPAVLAPESAAAAAGEPQTSASPAVLPNHENVSPAYAEQFSYNQEVPVVDSAVRSEPETEFQIEPKIMTPAQSPETLPPQVPSSPVAPLQAAPARPIPVEIRSKPAGGFVNIVAQNAAKALVSGRALASDAWNSARQFGQEYKQKLDLGRAERGAIRRQRLLALERQKVLAQERAQELDAARHSAAERLQQLLRERGEAAEHTQAIPPQATPSAPVAPAGLPQSRTAASTGFLRAQFIRLLGHRYSPQTEAIITGVAAVTALFAVGLVVASFHPRAALSNSLDQPAPARSGITVQTGGVTLKPGAVQTGGVTLKPAPGQPPAAIRPAAAPIPVPPKASPIHRAQAGSETSFGSDVTMRNLRPKQSAKSDVTVRRVHAQAKPAAVKLQPQDGIKHISDLDN